VNRSYGDGHGNGSNMGNNGPGRTLDDTPLGVGASHWWYLV
jgi:hypothetical protein